MLTTQILDVSGGCCWYCKLLNERLRPLRVGLYLQRSTEHVKKLEKKNGFFTEEARKLGAKVFKVREYFVENED